VPASQERWTSRPGAQGRQRQQLLTAVSCFPLSEALQPGEPGSTYAVFSGTPRRGTRAEISSSNPAARMVPRFAYFSPGKVSTTFPLRAGVVHAPTRVTVAVTVGHVAKQFTVTVKPRGAAG
jgi:hypothetical protein